jgi:hydrogenase expression/formation protein HypD
MDALALARAHPERQIVFFAVGFETTAPACAMAARQARQEGRANFSLLVAHVLVPPAMEALLASPSCRVQGFLAAGHVCTVMGTAEYTPIAARYRVPIVVTGFEPIDILQAIHMCVAQLEHGTARVENQYSRSVRERGNELAIRMIRDVFEIVARQWRGIGRIERSGLALRGEFADFDAERRFGAAQVTAAEPSECVSGLILQGLRKPPECPAFGTRCTPETPLGATMVSSEGACAAYYRYRRMGRWQTTNST